MSVHKSLAAALLMAVLAGCAELSAERPLFSTADQGSPPLTEGIWIAIGEDCAEYNVRRRRFPSDCVPLDIRRQEDGAWRLAARVDLVSDFSSEERTEAEANPSNGPFRVIFASAVERPIGEGYAPLYLAEVTSLNPDTPSVGYAVLAPSGAMPASEMAMILSIGCASILREGAIAGITPRYETRTDAQGEAYQELSGCVASTQASAREAARRAVIENLDELAERRFVFVRPN